MTKARRRRPAELPGDRPSESTAGRTVVGWREWVSLPEWGVKRLRAKIDTGARTSALHVENLEVLADGLVSFDVVLDRHDSPGTVRVTATERVRTSTVRPSSGVRQRRHVVETTMRLGEVEKKIEISLVDRGEMLCRMLVGRTALSTDFIVNPDQTYLASRKGGGGRKRTRAQGSSDTKALS